MKTVRCKNEVGRLAESEAGQRIERILTSELKMERRREPEQPAGQLNMTAMGSQRAPIAAGRFDAHASSAKMKSAVQRSQKRGSE